jgi:hypothetical protein
MPGPRNAKKKRKSEGKKEKSARGKERPSLDSQSPNSAADTESRSRNLSPLPLTLQPFAERQVVKPFDFLDRGTSPNTPFEDALLKSPYIHDPGNGPRVRDTRTFLSSYFAQPAALDDPLCAEFAQEVITTVLDVISF